MIDTDAFYRESCELGYVKLEAVARNVKWTTETEWGNLEITINLSKPEKDPRDIAAAAEAKATGKADYVDPATGAFRHCPLCVTDADVERGYARRLRLGGEPGEPWGLWYSPYAYYEEHCIAMSWEHRPMHIDRAAFMCLFDVVDQLPQYFFGSNADLPIVGGSILGHDHFQGGKHVFPMQVAPVCEPFNLKGFPEVSAGIVKWPMSVIRLCSRTRVQLVDAACKVLDSWRSYDDEEAGIVSESDGARHNTITPILRRREGGYQLDLALRCNITSEDHPLGVFHPHEHLHHIKKENIGLIEVMGLAILPPRVQQVMEERGLSRDDVGCLFGQVLECAGVFKWDDVGRAAQRRFIQVLAS
ncbi:MAG: hypothetical protein IJI68_01410 [Eggerthellaceae bacterium]|nr:hypothetical protein [Eggerthellaceae bacterium]